MTCVYSNLTGVMITARRGTYTNKEYSVSGHNLFRGEMLAQGHIDILCVIEGTVLCLYNYPVSLKTIKFLL